MATTTPRYVLDPAWEGEKERLEAIGRIFNPGTYRHLTALGVSPGWRCLELGGGTGTVATWLCEQVSPGGTVIATDLDTRFLDALEHEALDVRHHDLVNDPLEESTYDLIHARLLLEHLPEREAIVPRLVQSLRPGGWLLIEDMELVTWGTFDPPSEHQVHIADAIIRMWTAAGFDGHFGLRLPRVLRAAGLTEIDNEVRTRVGTVGEPQMDALTLLLEQMRPPLVATGLMTDEEVAAAIADARDTSLDRVGLPPLMISAWGRRPS